MGLELRYTSLFDLDGNGTIQELGAEFRLLENTYLNTSINKITGNNEKSQFQAMEDFSHIRLELKYYY